MSCFARTCLGGLLSSWNFQNEKNWTLATGRGLIDRVTAMVSETQFFTRPAAAANPPASGASKRSVENYRTIDGFCRKPKNSASKIRGECDASNSCRECIVLVHIIHTTFREYPFGDVVAF